MSLGFDASSQIFTTSASASGGDVKVASGQVKGLLSADVNLSGEFCHGIELGFGAGLNASASGSGQLLRLLGVDASATANAEADASIRCQMPLDVFDAAGLIVHAKAAATASVSARIGVNLLFDHVVEFGRARLDGVAFDLLLLFLEEAELGGEAFAMASAGASASAQTSLAFRLEEGDARFEATADAAVTWGVGGGVGAALVAGLDDPFRLYRRSVERIVTALIDELDSLVGPDLLAINEAARIALPIAFDAVYVFAQSKSLNRLEPDEVIETFLKSAMEQIQIWLLHKVTDIALEQLLEAITDILGVDAPTDDERRALAADMRALADRVRKGSGTGEEMLETFGALVDALERAGFVLDASTQRSLSVGWCALALGLSVQGLIQSSGGRAGVRFPGAPPAVVQSSIRLPRPPRLVRRVLAEHFGEPIPPAGLRVTDAVEFLVDGVAVSALLAASPHARQPIVSLAELFGVSVGELLSSMLTFTTGGSIQNTEIFESLRTWIGEVSNELAAVVESDLSNAPEHIQLWARETVRPSLKIINEFVFEDAAAFLTGASTDRSKNISKLSAASSSVIIRVLGRQFVTLSDIAFDAFRDAVHDECVALARVVRENDSHPLVALASTTLLPALPAPDAIDSIRRQRIQRLAAAVLDGIAASFGPRVWTTTRRANIRRLQLAVLDSAIGLSDSESEWFEKLAACNLPTSVADSMAELMSETLPPLVDSADALLRHVIPALSEFFLDVALEAVQQFDQRLLEALSTLAEGIQGFREAWANTNEVVSSLLITAEDAAQQVVDAIAQIATLLEPLRNSQTLRLATRRQLISLLTGRPLDNLPPDSELDFSEGSILFLFDRIPSLAWDAASLLLGTAINAALEIARASAVTIRQLRNLQRLIETMVDDVLGVLAGGIELLAPVLRQLLGIEFLEQLLSRALRAQRLENDARALAARAESAASIVNSTITIDSPARQTTHEVGGAYAGQVPLLVKITRAGRHGTAMTDQQLQPVGILLNGRSVPVPAGAWTKTRAGANLVHQLGTGEGLQHGLNAVEVTAVSGSGEPLRQVQLFAFDSRAAANGQGFELATDATVVDTAGNDHKSLNREKVTLRWTGSTTIDVTGWRLTDKNGRRTFMFPDHQVQPGQAVTVVTGKAPRNAGKGVFSWLQPAAVWNNRGDIVRLIDTHNVVQFEQQV